MRRVSWADAERKNGFYLNRYDVSNGFRYPLHDHRDHWEFVYVASGTLRHQINGVRTDHEAGKIILIRDKDAHALSGERFSYVNLAFTPVWLDRLELFADVAGLRSSLEASESPPEGIVGNEDRGRTESLFDLVLRAGEGPAAGLAFARTLPELIDLCDFDSGSTRAKSPAPVWLEELGAWAEREGGKPSPREFCEKSGYSREHVIRETRRRWGMTPTEYLESIRLKRAKDLLQYTNYPILRVAQDTGWESLRHFQRRFLAAVGCPPSEYRQRWARLAH